MIMSQDPHHGLQHRSLLTKISEHLGLVRENVTLADRKLIDLEAEIQAKGSWLERLEQQAQALRMEQVELEKGRLAQLGILEQFRDQEAMLQDFLGLLRGNLFQESEQGAVFFTHSLQDFAHFYGEGTLIVEAALKQSADEFSFPFQGKTFVYIRGPKGVYLHPEPVDLPDFFRSP